MKNSYCIENRATWTECSVEVDPDFVLMSTPGSQLLSTYALIKNMVEYWLGWENRLAANEGDYVKTFLQQLAREINNIQIENPRIGLTSIIEAFDRREGWCPMDGSFGIWIKQVDDFELSTTDYHVLDEGPIADQEAAAV